jgi:hypothetical protein
MRYLWLFCLSASLWGQTFDLSHFRDGSAPLEGRWKFHAGDDPRWADPNFDDSSWKLVKVPLNLGKQGYAHFSGYGWYRLELRMGAAIASQDLQLLIGPGASDFWAYEVYANGNRVGHFGSLPPQERLYLSRLMSFAIPKLLRSGQTRLLLAFRFWVPPRFASANLGGLGSGPLEIGTAATIQNQFAAEQHRHMLSQIPTALVNGTLLLLAAILLALYSFDRRPEYLLLGGGICGSQPPASCFLARFRYLSIDRAAIWFPLRHAGMAQYGLCRVWPLGLARSAARALGQDIAIRHVPA